MSHAVYEWNYPRQLLEIRLLETTPDLDRTAVARELFTETFLIKRPLLRALEEGRVGHDVLGRSHLAEELLRREQRNVLPVRALELC